MEDKAETQGRLTPQVHKRHPTQPTPETASWNLESTFVLPDPDSHVHLSLPPLAPIWTQWALPKHPWMAQTPCTGPQPPCSTRTSPARFLHIDQKQISTNSLGKLPWDGIPTALAWPQQHFWAAQGGGGGAKALQESCTAWSKSGSGHPEEP